jgi:hypothetical protein
MTHQQWETVEKSLSGLSPLDKLELVERLVHELRSTVNTERLVSANHPQPIGEDQFKQQLLASGLMTSLPLPRETAPRPEFHPIMIEGEPLSETIIRERR